MAIFGFGKEKKEGGNPSDLVLAYFEDAQRVRAPFTLTGPKQTESSATLQGLDESEGLATFQVSGPLIADKGDKLHFAFVQESLRLGGSCRVHELRPTAVVVELPEAMELMERRGQPRARLNPKEGATLTALTGLFDGVGITGVVENVSESGARIRVEKALNLKGEKRLPLGSALVPVGQAFLLVKLNKLPKCPAVMELEGTAVYLDASSGGLSMAIKFSKPRVDIAGALRSLVNSRTTAIPSAVPPKARRRPEPAGALEEDPFHRPPAPARPEPRAVEPSKAPPLPQPPPIPAPPAPAAALAAVTLVAPAPAEANGPEAPLAPPPKNDALLRMKKRSRAVVALASSPAFSDILKDFLQEEGYGRVLVTASMEELLEHLQQPNLGLVFLDGPWGTMEGLEFVSRLTGAFQDLPPIILAAEDISTSVVLAARRVGVAQLLVRPYAMDEALSSLFTQQMGLS